MGVVPKTSRREHPTPKRARFRALAEVGFSQRFAAKRAGAKRSTAQGWLKADSDRRTRRPGRVPILSDDDVQKIIDLCNGSYANRVRNLQDLAAEVGITCHVKTI